MAKKKRKNRSRKTPKQTLRVATGQAKKQEQPAVAFDVRADLRKAAILTAVCLAILFIIYLKL